MFCRAAIRLQIKHEYEKRKQKRKWTIVGQLLGGPIEPSGIDLRACKVIRLQYANEKLDYVRESKKVTTDRYKTIAKNQFIIFTGRANLAAHGELFQRQSLFV